MAAMHSLFLITSRQAFITQTERAAAGASGNAAFLLSGRSAPGAGAARAAVEALRAGTANVVLVDLDSGEADGLRALDELNLHAPEARVLVATGNRDSELILRAMRAGAADVLTTPFEPEMLTAALARPVRRVAGETPAPAHRGRVISFLGAKGGCGATTAAVNLGVALCARSAGRERSVVVLDMDSPGGDLTAMLKLSPTYSLADIASNIHRLDMDLLKSMTVRHDSGLRCVAASVDDRQSGVVTPDQMAEIVGFLRDNHDEVILAGGGLGPVEMSAVNQAHLVHVVTTLGFLSLRKAQLMIGRLREFGVTGDALRVVVNHHDRGADLTLRDARKALDAPVIWTIPEDARTAERAVNEGVPFSTLGRNRMQAAFDEYAVRLGSATHAEGGFNDGLGRLFRRLVPGRAGAPA